MRSTQFDLADIAVDLWWSAKADPEGLCYFVRCEATGLVKVGETEALGSRMRSLRTGSSSPLRVLAFFQGGRTLEQRFHERLETHRHGGEWFDEFAALSLLEASRCPTVADILERLRFSNPTSPVDARSSIHVGNQDWRRALRLSIEGYALRSFGNAVLFVAAYRQLAEHRGRQSNERIRLRIERTEGVSFSAREIQEAAALLDSDPEAHAELLLGEGEVVP